MIITIDGPSASGKSTVARLVAKELQYFYIASGLLYRGLAYALMHERGYTKDSIAQAAISDIMYCLDSERFEYHYDASDGESIIFQGEDITGKLKVPEIDRAASLIGTNPVARNHILVVIHQLAKHHNIVIDGRDCGSAMFPSAEYKFYLTASLQMRAKRWQAMEAKLNKHVSIDQAIAIIAERDERDTKRTIAPLQVPEGAVTIDSSDMQVQDVVKLIVQRVR